MAIQVTLGNTTYTIPSPGEDPGWGGDTTEYLKAIADQLNTISGPGDILEQTIDIVNTATTNDASGLLIDSSIVRAAYIDYSVYRTTSDVPSGNAEVGRIFVVYDDSASVGEKFQLSQFNEGDAGISFDITESTGQITYTITEVLSDTGTDYVGKLIFRASALEIV